MENGIADVEKIVDSTLGFWREDSCRIAVGKAVKAVNFEEFRNGVEHPRFSFPASKEKNYFAVCFAERLQLEISHQGEYKRKYSKEN